MDSYYQFDEHVFRSDVKKALKTVEKILEADRRPSLAENVHHKYENKYELANHMTNLAIVAQMNALERLGLNTDFLRDLKDTKTATTTLRFEASESCDFLKDQTVDVESPYSTETLLEKTSFLGSKALLSKSSTIRKVVKKVKEFHWTVRTHWEISVFSGTKFDEKIMLQSRDSSTIVITQSKDTPIKKVVNHTPKDLNLTWLLQQIDFDTQSSSFSIDTARAKTPRRNEEVEMAMEFFCSRMNHWANNLKSHFARNLQRIISNVHNPAVPSPSPPERLADQCSAEDLFQPIVPLLEVNYTKDTAGDAAKLFIRDSSDKSAPPHSISALSLRSHADGDQDQESCHVLSGKDTIEILNAQVKSIDSTIQSLQQVFPTPDQDGVFSTSEATLFLMLDHSERLATQYQHAVQYIEKMLENQLTAAIGKRVTNDDLEEFVRFHNAKFLTIPPKPFCYAIGRPKRFPYGVLSIESKEGDNNGTPIETLLRPVDTATSLEVPLNAATTLQLTGSTFLHGWMRHRSEQAASGGKSFQLSARARQFSSFLLVIGTMAGPNRLNPKDAIILQNKDEVLIPLLLEEIPSAKEFKDAIESLSPEQQQFAKSFRGMQLESSVFGVAVIQIKPQLEALLGLPEDSLAKEIKLTEELMELFVEYQVPSDLLSYDDMSGSGSGSSASVLEKVDSVRGNVKAVMDMIEGTKEKQLEQKLMRAEAAKAAKEEAIGATLEEEESFDFRAASTMSFVGDRGQHHFKRKTKFLIAPSSIGACLAAPEVSQGMPLPKLNQQRSLAHQTPGAPGQAEYFGTSSPPKLNMSSAEAVDFTGIPKTIDANIAALDKGSTLRSTKLKTNEVWSRERQPNLLTKPSTTVLLASDVKSESNKAYDLLDAISRSGSLPIAYSDLHVVICVTHCFEKDVLSTVVEDNINPIERLEMSTLLLGSSIHGVKPLDMIVEESDRLRLQSSFPKMLEAEEIAT